MIVEVVSVGTELLLGQIVNSNAAMIGRLLADNGFDCHFQTVVGDNRPRLLAALVAALARADAVIITGGIGPTQDDLTREALCELAGVEMTRDDHHAEWIESRLRAQRREPTDNVLRMADLPRGAEGLANSNGVALGVALEHHGRWLYALPGVPAEMGPMLEKEVLPRLRVASGNASVLRSRVLHCWGLGESAVAERLDDLFVSTNPSVAFLIRDMEVRIRISAKAADEAEALTLIDPVEVEVRRRLGDVVFAADNETVEHLVLDMLRRSQQTIATVEWATLGQVGARLAAVDAEGRAFVGSVVRRAAEDRDLDADVVLEVGPIGADTETGARTTRAVDMTVSTPLGTCSRVFEFGGDDERLRSFATIAAMHFLRMTIEEGPVR